ncbi:hypothetical protein CI610_02423 [invertebrate metagenome]|uniref:4-hydroxythreonine-4-phosphate dehydrogenase n=1 Tax=invertebrate metagenome TaxID=1711999 RepID=A0A2H9T604_9ZZZZ
MLYNDTQILSEKKITIMSDFIFMLTKDDQTVPDALAHARTAIQSGIRHIGFKNIGLLNDELKAVAHYIQQEGGTAYLEVVSLDLETEVCSAQFAVEAGINRLLGGTHPKAVLPIIEGTGIEYYPFPGKIIGHPSILTGTEKEIIDNAKKIAQQEGVTGLDLLAYRWQKNNVSHLIDEVCHAVDKPVIIAGSIDSQERIETVIRHGAAGFTVGTAAMTGAFPVQPDSLAVQLATIKEMSHTRV